MQRVQYHPQSTQLQQNGVSKTSYLRLLFLQKEINVDGKQDWMYVRLVLTYAVNDFKCAEEITIPMFTHMLLKVPGAEDVDDERR